jgi:flavin reductase (DIM6/NTAB) family NADH-FMN oxidoreductase RutF/nitroreductase
MDGSIGVADIGVEKFKVLMRAFGSSVVVITVSHDRKDHGMTATAVCSVSANPPQILVVINRSNRSHAIITAAKRFTINILSHHQAPLGQRFSEGHGAPFDGVSYTSGRHGGPILDGCAGFMECETSAEFEVGTHTIFVAKVVRGDTLGGQPLLYHAGSYKSLIGRTPDYGIADVFTSRWSPRAFTEVEIGDDELMTFLEAARWAPSAMNEQPWRFIAVKRNDESWPNMIDTLSRTNKIWASRASALVAFVSKSDTVFDGAVYEAPTHQFDTGAAWMSFALQAHLAGWHTHAMAGFDRERARVTFEIPENYSINALVAIGKQGEASLLPEALQHRELPSVRHPLSDLVSRGVFSLPSFEA